MKRLNTLLLITCMAFGHLSMASDIPAPDFALKSNSGDNIRLSELAGDVVLINFWATWCGPCRQEMPLLENLYQQYQDLGFVMLGINVEEDSNEAKAFLKDTPVSFPILFDTKNAISELYGVEAMPTTILVDRDGNVRHVHHGYKKGYEDKYQQQIRALVRE